MHQINIDCPAKLRQAIHYAQANGCEAELAKGFLHLLLVATSSMVNQSTEPYKELEGSSVCIIRADFAPHSFAWHVSVGGDNSNPGRCIYNGGLIYHGPSDRGHGDGPTFSVSLGRAMGQSSPHQWTIHT